ncbi:MAG TPA: hypothetical protein VMU76_01020 [Acidimicrobiales bacterium]|nr:hypothetical protein [Acidimicrobiales bacterium]
MSEEKSRRRTPYPTEMRGRANPIEAHFGPLRQFTIANSDHQSHGELATAIRNYIRWRNANTRDPEILALEAKHRAMLRGEARRRWGQPRARAA